MSFLNGTYRILSIKVVDTYFPIAYLEENGFSEEIEFLDTTTRANPNSWKSSIPTMQSYSLSFSGLISTANTNKVSFRSLEGYKRAKTKIEWKLESLQGDSIDYGEGYISNISRSSSIDEYDGFNGTIVGYGEPLVTTDSEYLVSDYVDTDYV